MTPACVWSAADQVIESGDRLMPSAQAFLDAAATDRPGVMFSMRHGIGAPRGGWSSIEEQLAMQGAMSFKREAVRGADLRTGTFMPGGVWFMLACFGAGTPDRSANWHWLQKLKSVGQFAGSVEAVLHGLPTAGGRPFIASIPQAVLANPNGPVAFMGHIDLAWTYSFRDLDTGGRNRPAKYMSLLSSALKGDRIGVAFHELYRTIHATNHELTVLEDQAEEARARGDAVWADVARAGHLWMLRNDVGAYVLLGDPAARLAITRQTVPRAAAAKSPELIRFGAPVAAPEPAELPLDLDDLEEAIAKYILGEVSPKAIAAEYGLSKSQLRDLAGIYQDAGRRALGVSD